jgi:hypothetical protein
MSALRHTGKHSPPSPATNMFLAYDTAETAQTARALVDHVASRLKTELALNAKLWLFDADSLSSAVGKAEAEAADADVMIVAFGPSKTLPESLLQWLGQWAEHRHNRRAALGFLPTGASTREPGPAVLELKALARRHGLDFIYHAGATGADNMASILLNQPSSQGWTWPPHEADSNANPEMPSSGWGIND